MKTFLYSAQLQKIKKCRCTFQVTIKYDIKFQITHRYFGAQNSYKFFIFFLPNSKTIKILKIKSNNDRLTTAYVLNYYSSLCSQNNIAISYCYSTDDFFLVLTDLVTTSFHLKASSSRLTILPPRLAKI